MARHTATCEEQRSARNKKRTNMTNGKINWNAGVPLEHRRLGRAREDGDWLFPTL